MNNFPLFEIKPKGKASLALIGRNVTDFSNAAFYVRSIP